MGKLYAKMEIKKKETTLTTSIFKPKLAMKRLVERRELVRGLSDCLRRNIPVIFIDETGFSMRPISKKEFTAPGRLIKLERSNVN